jgi:transcription antitermination factor NusG
MRIAKMLVPTITGLIVIAIAGCNSSGAPVLAHKLVATAGQTSIPLYPDEHTLIEVSHRSQQGGVTGMVGSVQKSLSAKQIDDQTPVQVLSTDDNGAQVQIIDGPLKGQTGFVAKQNVT